MARPLLPDLPTFCRGPFRVANGMPTIWGVDEYGDDCRVLDIRGWGYLTGHGSALALGSEEAFEAQMKTARFIADAMNAALEQISTPPNRL